MQIYLTKLYYLLLAAMVNTLREELPSETLVICLLAISIKFIAVKIPRIVAIVVSTILMGVLFFYQFSFFGWAITTEAAASFLVSLVCIRLVQDPTQTLKSDIILTFLIIAGASLFHSTLSFLTLAFGSFFLATIILQKELLNALNVSSLKNIVKLFSLILPLTTALFFFFPRFRSFMPSAGQNYQGQVGYSNELNNSKSGELKTSDRTAFYAEIPKLAQENMYWRGRALNYTDGYNWRMLEDNTGRVGRAHFPSQKIEYKVKYEQNFDGDLILLDVPGGVAKSTSGHYLNHRSQSFHTYLKNRKSFIDAYSFSQFGEQIMDAKAIDSFTQLPGFIPGSIKVVADKIKGNNPETVILNFERFLKKEKFSYSLSPGVMPSMSHFLEKKIGYCGHYSSLLAVLLRHLNIPARVITGFQGGNYLSNEQTNEQTSLITVRNQDAHAWVEYYTNKRWRRVDPTSFIAPERVFFSANFAADGQLTPRRSDIFSSAFNSARQTLARLDYQMAAFFDDFNRNYQESLAGRLKLSLTLFYLLGGTLLIISAIFAVWFFTRRIKNNIHPLDHQLQRFFKKLKKQGIIISDYDGLIAIKDKFESLPEEQKQKAHSILKAYEMLRYSKEETKAEAFIAKINNF